MQKVRIDKWLWAVRIYKTRSLSKKACEQKRVKIEDEAQKPSKTLQGGEIIDIRINHESRRYKVLKIIEKRVGAPIAITCYEDLTPEVEKSKKYMSAFHKIDKRERGSGRPTKKERREIDKYKDLDQ
ncbi:MAG: RNA-binding S4 domain-containing protein [Chitinophagales bacterium]|nr:RNA-binding S4 domain-containing protein [Chitinophagales bacterium]